MRHRSLVFEYRQRHASGRSCLFLAIDFFLLQKSRVIFDFNDPSWQDRRTENLSFVTSRKTTSRKHLWITRYRTLGIESDNLNVISRSTQDEKGGTNSSRLSLQACMHTHTHAPGYTTTTSKMNIYIYIYWLLKERKSLWWARAGERRCMPGKVQPWHLRMTLAGSCQVFYDSLLGTKQGKSLMVTVLTAIRRPQVSVEKAGSSKYNKWIGWGKRLQLVWFC